MVCKTLPNCKEVNLEQPSNALLPSVFVLSGIVTEVNKAHSLNAQGRNSVILLGNSILLIEVLENAYSPMKYPSMVSSFSGRVTLVNAESKAQRYAGILAIPSSITTLVMLLPANGACP